MENWSMSQSIKEGDICRGVVSDVADFGAFIDLGSCAGFVNVTEITWASFARVSEVMQRGQEVIAVLIGADPAREQLLLSIKGLQEDPIRKFAREEFGKYRWKRHRVDAYRHLCVLDGWASRATPSIHASQ